LSAGDSADEQPEIISLISDDDDDSEGDPASENSSGEDDEEEVVVSLRMSEADFTNDKQMAFKTSLASAATGIRAVTIDKIQSISSIGTCPIIRIEATVIGASNRLTAQTIHCELTKDGLPSVMNDKNTVEVILDASAAAGGRDQIPAAASTTPAVDAEDAVDATVLPASIRVSSAEFLRFVLPESPFASSQTYQKCIFDYFNGLIPNQSNHDWKVELESLRRIRTGSLPPSALSVWQAAGYKHAQKILSQNWLKGSLFWWSCGSGKSVMVALLIELLVKNCPDKRVVVVTTPQNVKENSLQECCKSLLKFSPCYAKGTTISDAHISQLLKTLRSSASCGIRTGDFWSFRQFFSQYQDKDMSEVCLIIDECHELFNEKLKNRDEIYRLISKADKVFLLSGTPWRTTDQMMQQLRLLHTTQSKAYLDEPSDQLADKLRRYSAGCVSYVDGTKDRSTHPIDGGWVVERCDMSHEQLFNFSSRCQRQLNKSLSGGIQNLCQLADLLTANSKDKRESTYTWCRHTQLAASEYWGSESSGLKQLLSTDPSLAALKRLAPKFEMLCKALQNPKSGNVRQDHLNTKHFVYSAYQSTITHLGVTMDKITSLGGHIFKQLFAADFEEHGGGLRLKHNADIGRNAIGFVILRGSAEEKKKLKQAFGFVSPGGERFQGLLRSDSKPLIQILLGSREANQGLTFLRLQHIHVMEPNPRGWGQIIQTIGRGIRRGTHEGIRDENQRTVRTTIYTTTLENEWLEKNKDEQMHEVGKELAKQRSTYHAGYSKLQRLVNADGVIKKDVTEVQKNLKTLAKNIQTLSADKTKLEEAWLRVPTGKISQKQGVSSPKTAMVRTWRLLPDEAVFRVTWAEEADRAKYDVIIKNSSVDFLLLKTFHMSRSESSASTQGSYTNDLEKRFAQAKNQTFAIQTQQFVGKRFSISPSAKKECNICRDVSSSIKGKQEKYGVECSQGHFVCSACYQTIANKSQEECLSVIDAHQLYLQRCKSGSIVECNAGNCFAVFCRAGIKFPLYWKQLDTHHCDFLENPFMICRLQSLIRESVRIECGVGCNGRDGDGGGVKSATVTRVLRIENGPLWENYWARKQKMIKDVNKSKRVPAKTMEQKFIFPNVQPNEGINELFLFHGTSKDSAFSIAKGGFDPSMANLAGMYGAGTYAADYSCKSMQYTPQDPIRVFIICRVLMGRAYPSKKTLQYYKEPPEENGLTYDSVYAKEGLINRGSQFQTHNEYVTYDPDQGGAILYIFNLHSISLRRSTLTDYSPFSPYFFPPSFRFSFFPPVYPEYIVFIRL